MHTIRYGKMNISNGWDVIELSALNTPEQYNTGTLINRFTYC